MATLYSNFLQGTLTTSVIDTDVSLSSTGFTSLPLVTSPNVLWIVLDPQASAGAPEVVQVTAHTLNNSSVTVTRGAQGSVARAHLAGTAWSHALTASDATTFGAAAPTAGFRNVAINGDFKVWQRGTSGAGATGAGAGLGYMADRWRLARGAYVTGATVSRQLASLDGFQYCARVQRDSGNTSTNAIYYTQAVETVNSLPFANGQITYSFYARKGADFAGSITASVQSGTATDQSNWPNTAPTGQVSIISYSFAASLTTSWQRFTRIGTVSATATQLFFGFSWTPSGTAGANDYFEITGVQLEYGNTATAFEQRTYGAELDLCHRYYRRTEVAQYGEGTIYGYNTINTAIGSNHPQPTTMRIAPIATLGGSWTYSNVTGALTISTAPTSYFAYVVSTASGHTFALPNSSGYIEFNAEL